MKNSALPGMRVQVCLRTFITVLTGLLLAAAAQPAQAARRFYLERPRWEAAFEYSYLDDQQLSRGQKSQGSSHAFNEQISVETSGWILHRALLEFDLKVSPEWQNDLSQSDSSTQRSSNSFFLGYGLSTSLLQFSRFPLRLHARNQSSESYSSLAAATTSESSDYGADLNLRFKLLPTTLSYSKSDQTQSGFVNSRQTSTRAALQTRNRMPRMTSELSGTYTDNHRTNIFQGLATTQDTKTASGTLTNNLLISADGRITLESDLNSNWNSSAIETLTTLAVDEFLSWKHTKPGANPTLTSSYRAGYRADWRRGVLTEYQPLSARLSLTHQLYENLTTSLGLNVSRTRSTGITSSSYGGSLGFDYQRRLPLGSLGLRMNHAYNVDATDSIASSVLQQGTYTFTIVDLIVLTTPSIDPASLVVTDTTGLISYFAGIDYTFSSTPGGGQIRRIPIGLGGSIAVGQSVRVSYFYQNQPSNTLGTLTRAYGISYTLAPLTLTYDINLSRAALLGGTRPLTLADDTSQTATAKVNLDWSESQITLEQQEYAAGNSQQRMTISESLRWRARNNLSLMANGGYTRLILLDSGTNGTTYNASISGQWQPFKNQLWRLEAFHTTSMTNNPSHIKNWGAGVFYEWNYALWKVKANYRYLFEDNIIERRTRSLTSTNFLLIRSL